ncbi:NADP-dependent oxidoreductase [Dactylosporangium sp. CA-092794]|uniref:NADP-dependent oxidoreductase n=1 Tax=Dactylosporangium sp. CA-092794 TaxID=3239929 RepID=UPI003D94201A
MKEWMKALVATGYGPPGQLSIADVPVPRPGPGQIQVRIAAATVNPTDIRVITGAFGDAVRLEFPYTLGTDFAGTVTEAGPGVTRYGAGDEVFGQAVPRPLRAVAAPTRPSLGTGALAEYAVFEADTPLLAHRPAGVPADQAAALAIAGLTAQALMTTAEIRPGESVLVIGATGGVGTTLVPLLAAARADIVATAATGAGGELLRRLGAGRVIGVDASQYPTGIDVVFNLALFADRVAAAARAIRPGGRLISIIYPAPAPEQLGRDDVDLRFVMDLEGRLGGMRGVAEAAASGALVATIGRRYGLDEAVRAAVDYARGGTLGKIVVTM